MTSYFQLFLISQITTIILGFNLFSKQFYKSLLKNFLFDHNNLQLHVKSLVLPQYKNAFNNITVYHLHFILLSLVKFCSKLVKKSIRKITGYKSILNLQYENYV